ncbi:hypothetical protein [Ruminococcus sp.]|uniref:hypothetical protein n=1 Tax=Ruminococcus sp. TaxID=41978 RepID=UPI003FED572D
MADTEKKAQQEATAEKKAKKASAKTDSKNPAARAKKMLRRSRIFLHGSPAGSKT